MKLRDTVIAIALAFPFLASAQSSAQLQSEIEILKAQVKELQELIRGKAAAPAVADAAPSVELEEFNRIKTKVEAADDVSNTNGMKGLRISGGIDPVYIWNQNKNSSGFSFGNTPAATSYDDSMFGVAYLDLQKEMEGGTKFHLTLMPTKSAGGTYTASNGSIIQEASASIPINGASTRLMVGQMPDVSGYEPWYPTYVGENNITSNLLYPTYATNFVTHNLLWDFTGAYFYTGVGLDMVRGPWETKLFVANVNASRGDKSPIALSLNTVGQSNQNAGLIYNAAYTQEEFWGVEFTGYLLPNMPTPTGGAGTVNSFEIDGNFTRGTFNGNLQFTYGTQQNGAYNFSNGNPQDSRWYGMSLLLSEKVDPRWTLATRLDYLNNQANGGGIFTLGNNSVVPTVAGDVINGFGQDPSDPTGQTGTNRAALAFSATYHLNQNASLRGEFRRDFASTAAFYDYNSGNMSTTNNIFALQALVNF